MATRPAVKSKSPITRATLYRALKDEQLVRAFEALLEDVAEVLPDAVETSTDGLATVATTGAYSDLVGRPTLGTAAATDASDYATAAHGHSVATGASDGFMSAADKTKLDGIETSAAAERWTWLKLGSNSTVSTTAFANVTGLSFTAAANTTYLIDVFGAYQTAATTTGIALTLDIPSGSIIGINVVATSATALGGTEIIADAASTGATTGVRAATTNTPIAARFIVAVGGSGGTVQLMQRSEVAASDTVLQANLTALGYRAI